MAATHENPQVRTYGNWRRPQLPTFGAGVGFAGVVVIFIGVLGLIVLAMLGQWVVAAVWLLIGLVLLLMLRVRDKHQRTLLERSATRAGWRRARRRRRHVYRSGPLGRTPWGSFQLPGILAASKLHEAHDSYGRPFALLEHPYASHWTIVLAAEPDGDGLVDVDQVDGWVAAWGQWLAMLGQEIGVVSAAVTVETAPDTGARLRREVEGNLSPNASPLARTMLLQVTQGAVGASRVRAWVSITVNGKTAAGKTRTADQVARDLASRIAPLTQTLGATGAGGARPVSAAELCEIVRVAYDPVAEAWLDEARDNGQDPELSWDEVGPAAHQASWDLYRHDSAVSKTWMMSVPPRGEVFSNVLGRLMRPHGEVDRKRVTIMYAPLELSKAAQTVENDLRFAATAVQGPRASARDQALLTAAQQTAQEEARGAGLVDFGMLITATVSDPSRVADATAAVEGLAASSKILIRPSYGSQDSAFAACLPLGLVLSRYQVVPAALKAAL